MKLEPQTAILLTQATSPAPALRTHSARTLHGAVDVKALCMVEKGVSIRAMPRSNVDTKRRAKFSKGSHRHHHRGDGKRNIAFAVTVV